MLPSCKLLSSPCANTFSNAFVGISPPAAAAAIKANARIDVMTSE
jgi:hypothetical protein